VWLVASKEKNHIKKMEYRALTKSEIAYITELYETTLIFKFGEFVGRTIVSFGLLAVTLFSLEDIFGNIDIINVRSIIVFALTLGLLFSYLKLLKRKKMFQKAFSSDNAVEIHYFKIDRYTKSSILKSKYQAYICEISKEKTVQFISKNNLGNPLNRNIKIEVIKLESPLILKTSTCIPKEDAEEVKPTKFLVVLMEELAEYEFCIHDEAFDTYFD
jgi:hypothetical protein